MLEQYFSIVIINSCHQKLENLIDSLAKQLNKIGEFQLVIINSNLRQKAEYSMIESSIKCFNQLKKVDIIDTYNQDNNYVENIYQTLLNTIEGEIAIFTQVGYYPDDNWLESIINSFKDEKVNMVAGEIRENQYFLAKTFKIFSGLLNRVNYLQLSHIFDGQIANFAIRTNFMKQQKSLNLNPFIKDNLHIYYRILRELEAEIFYNPSCVVYKKNKPNV